METKLALFLAKPMAAAGGQKVFIAPVLRDAEAAFIASVSETPYLPAENPWGLSQQAQAKHA